jgi:hypothetical protein
MRTNLHPLLIAEGLPSGMPGIGAFGDEAEKEKEAMKDRLAQLETKVKLLEETVEELKQASKPKPGCCAGICAKLCGCFCRRRLPKDEKEGDADKDEQSAATT